MVSAYILGMLLIGLLLLTVGWGSEWIARLPLSYAILYLVAGIILGPYGIGLIRLQPDTQFIERFTEFVVIVSLYSCGLKISRPLRVSTWNSTIRLIGLLMPLSILAIAAVGHWLVQLSWPAAVLLGAVLAPTDPVLASEVQLDHPDDPNELRFGLTSEGGLNDALAFPFVYFGLHWLNDPNWDNWFPQWVGIDLVWAIGAAIVVGFIVARGGIFINHHIQKARGVDEVMADLVAVGVILLTYALTEVVNGYGFLAVFVAGYVVRKYGYYPEQQQSQLEFTTQIEKLLEVGAILLLGSLLRVEEILEFGPQALLVAGALLFVVRPIIAWLSTIGSNFRSATRLLFGWFGIRGIGSIYYLSYAISDGIPPEVLPQLRWIVYLTVLVSIIIHGVTATPLVEWHERHIESI
ncbi:sodium:proton antiporter [Oscillatoria sp. CS-180]|uniref:cation:proton antiporter n=1 Tax=Oscillatoria sp. CS-180 TaxID=3021720 RepID=UPI00232BE5B6|nr:sodium:proton antiporter [Oscillatoria sp. CS-180]MDB9527248.1 sodium:proton antiporter [Oscillatoria sp. CS-180]